MPSSKRAKTSKDSLTVGREYEELAARFFLDKGFQLLHRNYRAGHKEIDLIVRKGDTVAFVEVKSARSKSLGHPSERITKKKRENLIKAAQQYLIENKIDDSDFRFDAVTFVDGKIEHYPDAFSLTDDV
jgi:putative endonuclease